MPIRHCLYFVTTLLLYSGLNAQPRTSTSPIIDTRYVDIIDNKASTLEKKLDRQSEKIIAQFLKQENKLRRKLARKDSAAAIAMLGDTKEQYNKLQQKLASTEKLKQYIPSLDTLSTSLKFLQQNPQLLAITKDGSAKLNDAMSKVIGLQNQFQKAEEIKKFIKERKQYLKNHLENLG